MQIHAQRRRFLAALAATAAAQALGSEAEERRIPVKLEGGKARSFDGEITEYEVTVYVVSLRQGQPLQVVLTSNNASNCFDIHAPGVAKPVFVGGESGSSARLVASASGDYLIKVFLLRLAARDGQTAKYALELGIAPWETIPTGAIPPR